ncbi:hypothetical protein LINPERPRIM_LOCUS36508 [Linum perenne]
MASRSIDQRAVALVLIVIIVSILKLGCSDEIFGYRWNTTVFIPYEQQKIKSCVDNLIRELDVSDWLTYKGNRDKTQTCPNNSSQPDLYTWVHCSSGLGYEECKQCLKSASSVIRQCCKDSYGVNVKSDDCEVRYETYNFTIESMVG